MATLQRSTSWPLVLGLASMMASSCHCSQTTLGDAREDSTDTTDEIEIVDSYVDVPDAEDLADTVSPDVAEDPAPDTTPHCPDVPVRIAGDINGDGLSDLVTSDNDFAYVLFGQTSFPASEDFPSIRLSVPTWLLAPIEVCDVDGDCLWDIIVKNEDFHVYLGQTISTAVTDPVEPDFSIALPVGPEPWNPGADVSCAGDLDGDSYQDLVFGTVDSFAILYGRASFPEEMGLEDADVFTSGVRDSDEWHHVSVSGIGDFDGDGLLDIAVFQPTGGGPRTVCLLLGWGRKSGAVRLTEDSVRFSMSGDPTRVSLNQVGDVNHDDLSDFMVMTGGTPYNAYLILGRPDPGGTTPAGVDVTFPDIQAGVGIGDWTGDGIDDLLLADESTPGFFQGTLYIIEGRTSWPATIAGSDTHYAEFFCDLSNCRLGRGIAATEDMDGDGYQDIFGIAIPEPVAMVYVFTGMSGGWAPTSLSEAAAEYSGDRYMQDVPTVPPFLWIGD